MSLALSPVPITEPDYLDLPHSPGQMHHHHYHHRRRHHSHRRHRRHRSIRYYLRRSFSSGIAGRLVHGDRLYRHHYRRHYYDHHRPSVGYTDSYNYRPYERYGYSPYSYSYPSYQSMAY